MFGAHYLLPKEPWHYSWLSPYPGDTQQYSTARQAAKNVAMALDGLLVSKKNTNSNPVTYSEALENGWLMIGGDGQPVPYSGGDRFVCDPAAPGYAEAWAKGAIAKARQYGCDYIWIDSIANEKLRWIVDRDKIPAKYRTANDALWEVWRDNIFDWMADVWWAIHDAGLKVAINTGDRSWLTGPMAFVGLHSDALMNEGAFFSISGTGEYETAAMCDRLIEETQGEGCKVLLLSKIPQSTADFDKKVEFALACFLIARKPGDVFFLWDEKPREQRYPRWSGWHPSFERALALGRPLTKPRKWFGWWWRLYRHGLVMVDTEKRQVAGVGV